LFHRCPDPHSSSILSVLRKSVLSEIILPPCELTISWMRLRRSSNTQDSQYPFQLDRRAVSRTTVTSWPREQRYETRSRASRAVLDCSTNPCSRPFSERRAMYSVNIGFEYRSVRYGKSRPNRPLVLILAASSLYWNAWRPGTQCGLSSGRKLTCQLRKPRYSERDRFLNRLYY